jgi:RHS repeat-associated protein
VLLRAVLVRARVLVVLVVLSVLAGGGWLAVLPVQSAAAAPLQLVDAAHVPKPAPVQKPVSLRQRRKELAALSHKAASHALPEGKAVPATARQVAETDKRLKLPTMGPVAGVRSATAASTYTGLVYWQISQDPFGELAAQQGGWLESLGNHVGAAVPGEPLATAAAIYQNGGSTTQVEWHPVKVTWQLNTYGCDGNPNSQVFDFNQTVSAPSWGFVGPDAPTPPTVSASIVIPNTPCTRPDSSIFLYTCTQVTDDPTSTMQCNSYNAFVIVPYLPANGTHGCVCGDISGAPRSDVMRGDPVNTATGEYTESFTDASVAAPGVAFAATRSYGSGVTVTGALGKGWLLPWETSLQFDSGGNALLQGEGAAAHGYTKNSDGTFTPVDSARSALAADGTGYRLTTLDHRTLLFDSGGHLTSEKNSSGQGLTVAYTGGVPSSIADAAGRTVSLSYTGGRLSQITLADGRHVGYGYTSGQLTSVTALDGTTSTYGYDTGGRLNSVTDALSHRQLFNVYDAQGRVTSQTDATNRQTRYAYDTAGVFNVTQTTAPDGGVWSDIYAGNMLFSQEDPLGNRSYYRYDPHYNRTSAIDGNTNETSWDYYDSGLLKDKKTVGTEQWTYDASGNPATYRDGENRGKTFTYGPNNTLIAVKDGLNKSTIYTYYPNGLLKTATTPLGKATTYEYDAAGNPKSVTTPEGRKTSYTYDASGRLTAVVDPRGNASGADPTRFTTSYGYDNADRVTAVTDANQHTTRTEYDAAGNVHKVTDPAGRVTLYAYDDANRPMTLTDPALHDTKYGYDAAGRRNSVTDRTGATTTTVFDKAGRVASMVTARGNVSGATASAYTWTYGYDHVGNRTSTTDPLNRTTAFGYDAANQPLTTIDPLGHTRTVQYDRAGNVTLQTDALNHQSAFGYDADNHLTSTTTHLNNKTKYEFDDDGNLTGQLSPLLEHTTYGYDGDGLRTSTVDPRGNVTGADPAAFTWKTTYDEAGEPIAVTDPLGHVTKTGYDAVGNVTSTTDAANKTSITAYDELDRVKTTTAADGGKTVYAYDTAGNLHTTTDPNNHITTYGDDNEGRVTSITDPLNRATGFLYDAEGNRYQATNARGQTITSTYDARNLVTKVTYSDGTPSVTTVYDNAGHPQTVTDATGTRTLAYYDNDKLQSVTSPGAAQPFKYTYNPDGTTSSRTYPDGTATSYAYDHDGRITGQTVNSKSTGYGYDAAGNLTTTTLPGTQRTETRGYDTAGQMTAVTETNGTTTTSTAYGLDADGRVTDTTATGPTGTQTPLAQYRYDSTGRLIRSCTPTSVGANCADSTNSGKTLSYDKAGNLQSTGDTALPLDLTGVTQTVTADLNNDGITDVITTDATSTVRTYLGRGDGTFLPGSQLTGTGTGFAQVLPVEYTGDGKTDLLAIDTSTGHLLRYNGDGQGGFAAPFDMGASWGVMTLTGGDFNGDGKQDFLASSSSANTMYFYPGNGTGGFGTRTTVGTGWSTYRLISLDYNSDGKLDVLGINSSDGHLYFYPGKGDGTLGTRTDLGTGWGAMYLVPGDFNKDGKTDFLARDTANNKVRFYPATGTGTFGTYILQTADWSTFGTPAAGQFDTDSALDIVATDSTNHLRRWHGDGAGHLTGATITTGGSTNTYDAADQLTQTLNSRTATGYSYDSDGNQTKAGATTYTYDPAGRVTGSTSGTTTYAFTYDGDGNRTTTKKNNSLVGTARWDINNPLPQIATETDSTGALIGDYQYDPTGTPQSVNRSTSSAFYYLHDQQNSVTAVVDGTGAQTYHYTYDTYGTPTSTADVTGGQQSAFGFTGQYKDPSLAGRLDLRARTLDTTTGRFTTRDPVPNPTGSPNPSAYAYANNDPVNQSDPSGACPMCISALVGASIGALVGGGVYAWQHRDGNWDWSDFASSTAKGTVIGFGAGLLAPAGGTSAAFLGFEEGTASYYATAATVNGLISAGYTWAVNTAQCQPTTPQDLLFGFAGGFFGTYAGPAFTWTKGLFGSDIPGAGRNWWGVPQESRFGGSYYTPETNSLRDSVNPGGGTHNCGVCADAADSTIGGNPKSADPAPRPMTSEEMERYVGNGNTFVRKGGLSGVVNDVKNWGPGSRGIVGAWPTKGVGHYFNVINVDGKVVFIDAQTGKANPVRNYTKYYIMRTH